MLVDCGRAVDERHPVQQEPCGERTEQEILHGGLVAGLRRPREPGKHVERNGHRLESEEEHDEIVRSRHHHHAGHRARAGGCSTP